MVRGNAEDAGSRGAPPADGMVRGGAEDAGRTAHGSADMVVVLDDSEDPPKARACFDDGSPLDLGTPSYTDAALSPDGQHLAVRVADAADGDVVSTVDASAQRLVGEGIDFASLRWAPDATRLAYLAGGVPCIADGDGTNARSIDVSLPEPPVQGSALAQIEWSDDLAHVAFVTRGAAVLADTRTGQGQIVSRQVVVGHETVAFSRDGSMLAVLEADGASSSFDTPGALLLVHTDTLQARAATMMPVMDFVRWSADGRWLAVNVNRGVSLVAVESLKFADSLDGTQRAPVSPDGTKVASVIDGGIHIRNFDGTEDRVLAADASSAEVVQWAPDGSAIAYVDGSGLHVVRTSDGAVLLSDPPFRYGVDLTFGPDGWVATNDFMGTMRTQRLGSGADAGASFSVSLPNAPLGFNFLWLDAKIAFVGDGALHIARPDVSDSHVACRAGRLYTPQGRL